MKGRRVVFCQSLGAMLLARHSSQTWVQRENGYEELGTWVWLENRVSMHASLTQVCSQILQVTQRAVVIHAEADIASHVGSTCWIHK